MMTDRKVVAIVLNWNGYEDTENCIESLKSLSYDPFQIIVVDNGSTDGSEERLKNEFPNITVLQTGTNLGFSGGMNVGIEEALDQGASYVWLVNNDVVIPERTVLTNLVSVFDKNENAGIVTPVIKKYPETDEVWFYQGVIDSKSGNAMQSGPDEATYSGEYIRNDYIPNCCALVKSEVFETVGLLDEKYFLYYEDVDLGTRARKNGFVLVTHPRSEVYHKVNASSSRDFNPIHSYYKTRNWWFYSEDQVNSLLFYPIYLWWVLKAIVDRTSHQSFTSTKAILEGIIDALFSREGQGRYP